MALIEPLFFFIVAHQSSFYPYWFVARLGHRTNGIQLITNGHTRTLGCHVFSCSEKLFSNFEWSPGRQDSVSPSTTRELQQSFRRKKKHTKSLRASTAKSRYRGTFLTLRLGFSKMKSTIEQQYSTIVTGLHLSFSTPILSLYLNLARPNSDVPTLPTRLSVRPDN